MSRYAKTLEQLGIPTAPCTAINVSEYVKGWDRLYSSGMPLRYTTFPLPIAGVSRQVHEAYVERQRPGDRQAGHAPDCRCPHQTSDRLMKQSTGRRPGRAPGAADCCRQIRKRIYRSSSRPGTGPTTCRWCCPRRRGWRRCSRAPATSPTRWSRRSPGPAADGV